MRTAIKSTRKVPAVGYVRVSLGRQASEGASLEEQRDALAFYAASNGMNLVGICEDAGISGSKDEDKRPGLAAAIEAVRTGRARVLLVRDLPRLARGMDLTGYLRVTVQKAGGVVKVIGESEDRIYRLFDTVRAEMYRTAVSDRMKLWAASRQAKGLPLGPAPFGYQMDADGKLVPLASEAAVVKKIVALRAEGLSLRKIAMKLKAGGHSTRNGEPWAPQTLSKILRREQA